MLKEVIGLCLLIQFLALTKSEQRGVYYYIPSVKRMDNSHASSECKIIGGEMAMPKTEIEMKAVQRSLASTRERK